MKVLKFALVALLMTSSLAVRAEDTGEKMKADAKQTGHDMKVGAKKAGRKVQDETCEMVNGKMECAAKKAGHKVENAVDDVKK